MKRCHHPPISQTAAPIARSISAVCRSRTTTMRPRKISGPSLHASAYRKVAHTTAHQNKRRNTALRLNCSGRSVEFTAANAYQQRLISQPRVAIARSTSTAWTSGATMTIKNIATSRPVGLHASAYRNAAKPTAHQNNRPNSALRLNCVGRSVEFMVLIQPKGVVGRNRPRRCGIAQMQH